MLRMILFFWWLQNHETAQPHIVPFDWLDGISLRSRVWSLSSNNLPIHCRSAGKGRDQNGAVVPRAQVSVQNNATGLARNGETDSEGNYQIVALPVGNYRVEVEARGFRKGIVEQLVIEVARIVVQDFHLAVGDINQTINVTPEARLIEAATVSIGQVVDQRTVQELPLNGRHFIDLGLLVPGSVTPPQNGTLSPSARGQGSFALNTAGNREDAVNFQINGINLNDQINNIITFLPPISGIQEFMVDNSTFSAEYGRNSGAIVNIATRRGRVGKEIGFGGTWRNLRGGAKMGRLPFGSIAAGGEYWSKIHTRLRTTSTIELTWVWTAWTHTLDWNTRSVLGNVPGLNMTFNGQAQPLAGRFPNTGRNAQ